MGSESQRGRVKFIVKERSESFWLAIEPMAGRLDILKNGMFGFELHGRPSYDEAKLLADYLNERISEMSFLPGSAHVVEGTFGDH